MNSNPVVLITGATKGIGRAIAERFAETASELHVVARNQEDLNAMKTALERPGLSVAVYCADLSKPNEVGALVVELQDRLPRLDVLVNNAGVYLPGSLLEEDFDNLRYMMQLNVLSHYEITRGLVSVMSSGSHIIN
ncbi:MAG: SDR family NAD(P)-dependent oxidoreductase, partial [Flavobacteriales bacterium]|nr:SDR family NAD(P)-dependent oxidoreductase [Flavobacteriales bacterium]